MMMFLEDIQYLALRESTINLKPQESNIKPSAKSYELKPRIIELAARLSFGGADSQNPYKHLEKHGEICRTFQQDGVPAEWVKWNLFPFTLIDKAQRWYQLASRESQGDWGLLMENFIASFFPIVKVHMLRKQVWSFEQEESEDIDEAWERLNNLLTQGPNLGVTSEESLHIFYFGLTSEAFTYVNICAGGSLIRKSISEANKILSNICLTPKEKRERREAKGAEVVPTPEDKLPVSLGFDDRAFDKIYTGCLLILEKHSRVKDLSNKDT